MRIRLGLSEVLLTLALFGPATLAEAQTAANVECSGCVDRGDIATGAVISTKIAVGAVTTTKIGVGSVTTAKIKTGAVTLDRLAPEVQSKLSDAVTLDRLAPEVQSRLVPVPSSAPYLSTSVSVDCSSSSSALNEALAALNPAASVYDVAISGNCAENLELFNFHSLTLRSADPANPATVGRVLVQSGSSYVQLAALRVQTLGQGSSTSMGVPVIANYGTGRLQLQNVELVCSPLVEGGNCDDVVVVNSGDGRLNGMMFTGAWAADSAGRKGAVVVNRGANAIVQPLDAPCLGFKSIIVNNMSTAQVADGSGCEMGMLSARSGGAIVFSGGTADVEVRQGTVMANSSAGNGAWYRSLSCDGVLSAVVDQFGGNTNFCAL